MRGELTKIDQQLQERATAAAALRKESEILRDKLAEAEQRLRDGETANTALRAEIKSLNSHLAIAREVGGAAIAALRTETAAAPEPPPKPSLLANMLRVFRFRARVTVQLPGDLPAATGRGI
jgi:septal ring factor EnvC (AmiA/AmiB activator)